MPAAARAGADRPAARPAAPTLLGEAPLAAGEEATFERLRALRREIAAERGVPPYVVFPDSTLRELARQRPATLGQLFRVRGIGERKATDYGDRLLALLAAEPETAEQG